MKLPLLNIFRTSKVFAVVLGLHLFVLSLLLFHPGCQRSAPSPAAPTESAPMGEVSSLDNATLATPTRPPEAGNPALNDAAAATTPVTTASPTVVANEAPPVPVPSETSYTVEKGDSLWSISRKNGVTVTALLDANGLTRNSVLKPGEELKIPAATTAPAGSEASSTNEDGSVKAVGGTYKVQTGDTLAKIAKANHVSVRALKKANHLHSDTVRVGQTLKIPSGKHRMKPAPADTVGPYDSAAAPSGSSSDGSTTSYTVEKGDSPATIAKKFGMKTGELMAMNDISDPRKLKVGQELKVKTSSSSPDAAPAPAATAPVSADSKPMSPEALEAATATTSDANAPVVEVKPAATVSK